MTRMRRKHMIHGTFSMYTHGACRCDKCREAATIQHRAYRLRPLSEKNFTHGHGGYTTGCRCDVCSKAKRDYNRGLYKKKQSARLAEDLSLGLTRAAKGVAKLVRPPRRYSQYPFRSMEVGESFIVPFAGRKREHAQTTVCSAWRREAPKKFSSHVEHNGVRVWRVE